MKSVLDASSILAVILMEPGHEKVAQLLGPDIALICTVNLSEVVSVLARQGMAANQARGLIGRIPLGVVDLDWQLAFAAGEMFPATKPFGLSLGDRCCLALAARENAAALTADRAWLQLAPILGIAVTLIR